MGALEQHPSGSWFSPDDPGERDPGGAPRLSITDAEGELLTWLARDCRVVEIGTGLGVSTRYLARSASEVVTFDTSEWVRDTIWPALPGNVTPLAERADVYDLFDMAFIDGGHLRHEFDEDLAFCETNLRTGALIVCHDSVHMDWVRDGSWQLVGTQHGLALRFR